MKFKRLLSGILAAAVAVTTAVVTPIITSADAAKDGVLFDGDATLSWSAVEDIDADALKYIVEANAQDSVIFVLDVTAGEKGGQIYFSAQDDNRYEYNAPTYAWYDEGDYTVYKKASEFNGDIFADGMFLFGDGVTIHSVSTIFIVEEKTIFDTPTATSWGAGISVSSGYYADILYGGYDGILFTFDITVGNSGWGGGNVRFGAANAWSGDSASLKTGEYPTYYVDANDFIGGTIADGIMLTGEATTINSIKAAGYCKTPEASPTAPELQSYRYSFDTDSGTSTGWGQAVSTYISEYGNVKPKYLTGDFTIVAGYEADAIPSLVLSAGTGNGEPLNWVQYFAPSYIFDGKIYWFKEDLVKAWAEEGGSDDFSEVTAIYIASNDFDLSITDAALYSEITAEPVSGVMITNEDGEEVTEATLTEKETLDLTAVILPTGSIYAEDYEVVWSIGSEETADVKDGVVTAAAAGETTVTATLKEKDGSTTSMTAEVTLTVKHGDLEYHEAEAADCLVDGNVEYWQCPVCEKYFADEDGIEELESITDPALGKHTYADGVYESDEKGHWQVCTECGEETEPEAHSYTAGKYEHNDSEHWQVCTVCGEKSEAVKHSGGTATCEELAVCGDCGVEYGEYAAHDLTHYEAVEATCVKKGSIEYWECEVCGKLFDAAKNGKEITTGTETDIDPDNHVNKEIRNDKQPTLDEAGYSGDIYCADCDTLLEKGEEIAPHEHQAKKIAKADPTCTEPGYEAYVICTVCEKLFTDDTWENPIPEPVEIPALKHDYQPGKWTWAEDYSEATLTFVCANDDTHTVEIEAEVTSDTTKPTCEKDGSVTYTAEAEYEGKTYTDSKEAAILSDGHSLAHVEAKEAAIGKDGNIEHWVCEVCGKLFSDADAEKEITKEDIVIPALEDDEPEDPSEEPEDPSEEPEDPSDEPEDPSDEPEDPSEEPEDPSDEPEDPSDEPEDPSDEPEDPSEEPEDPSEEPEDPSEEPEDPSDEPEDPSETEKPSEDVPEEAITLTDDDTDIVVSAAAGVLKEGVKLNVVPDVDSQTETSISFDITLTDADGNVIQPNGTVTVSIPVPAGWNTDKLYVYRVEADGTYTNMNAKYADGCVTFTTDHFSTYILTTEVLDDDTTPGGETDDSDNPSTGVAASGMTAMIVIFAASAAGVAVIYRRKKD